MASAVCTGVTLIVMHRGHGVLNLRGVGSSDSKNFERQAQKCRMTPPICYFLILFLILFPTVVIADFGGSIGETKEHRARVSHAILPKADVRLQCDICRSAPLANIIRRRPSESDGDLQTSA